MNTVLIIMLVIFGINGNLIGLFEKITKNEFSKGPSWIFVLFIFFGLLMFPFYKIIKKYRKRYDVEKDVLEHEAWWNGINPPWKVNEEYLEKKRWLKLQKLRNKIKR